MMGSVDCMFSSDDIVVKPPNDKRLYRTIELHNGLCALLVNDPEIYPGGCPRHSNSEDEQEAGTGDEDGEEEEEFEDGEEEDDDEEEEEDEKDGDVDGKDEENGEIQPRRKGSSSQTKKAAAAMCVGMGSFSDPLGTQGLVHFLEHMLFMGSKDFPDENEYDSYLSKHGGSSNAYTETEHTCYHFEVKREYLRGALKRFCKMMLAAFSNFSAIHLLIVIPSIDFLGAIRRVSLKQRRGVNLPGANIENVPQLLPRWINEASGDWWGHMGLVDRGWFYFNMMSNKFNIDPKVEHYACMVDVLSRAGKLNEAKGFIESARIDHGMCLWHILLSGCRNHHNYELGAYAGEKLMALGSQDSSAYALLSSVYTALGRLEDVERVKRMMRSRGVNKEPGCSWIELKDRVHVFVVGDQMRM